MKNCAHCQEPFNEREAKQRFCAPACKVEYFAEERRRALQLFRAQRSEIEVEEHTQ